MTQPFVRKVAGASEVTSAVRSETYAAFVAVAASVEAVPAGLQGTAEKWRDRHVFAVSPNLRETMPEGVTVPDSATMAVVSLGSQQWPGADNTSTSKPAAAFFDGDLNDKKAVAAWVANNRFPGIFVLGDSNFYEFTHSAKRVVILAADPSAITSSQESLFRGVAEKMGHDFYFGVVNGVAWAEELSDFNIAPKELPRVLVVEEDFEAWYEDKDLLVLESMEEGLEKIVAGTTQVLKQTRSAWSRLMFYQRELTALAVWLKDYAQRGPKECVIAVVLVISLMTVLGVLGWCASACCKVLMDEEEPYGDALAREARHRAAVASRAKAD